MKYLIILLDKTICFFITISLPLMIFLVSPILFTGSFLWDFKLDEKLIQLLKGVFKDCKDAMLFKYRLRDIY